MTQATATAAVESTLASLLLPGSRDTRLRLERVLSNAADDDGTEARRMRVLGTVARNALLQEIETKLRGLLSETLADLVVGGWRVHGTIRAARRKSLDEPGVDQVVPLRSHLIKADRAHELDVVVDGVHLFTLSARLDAALQVFDAVAVVRDGHLADVRSGQSHITAVLRVEGAEVAQQKWTFPLTAELSMHQPIDLSAG